MLPADLMEVDSVLIRFATQVTGSHPEASLLVSPQQFHFPDWYRAGWYLATGVVGFPLHRVRSRVTHSSLSSWDFATRTMTVIGSTP